MSVVVIFIVAVIMYRVIVTMMLGHGKKKDLASGFKTMFASVSSSVLNLIVIMFLSKVYEKLAVKLTEWGQSYLYSTVKLI